MKSLKLKGDNWIKERERRGWNGGNQIWKDESGMAGGEAWGEWRESPIREESESGVAACTWKWRRDNLTLLI